MSTGKYWELEPEPHWFRGALRLILTAPFAAMMGLGILVVGLLSILLAPFIYLVGLMGE